MLGTGIVARYRRFAKAWDLWGPKLTQAAFSASRETTNHTYPITRRNRLYLAHFVSQITGRPAEEVLGYFREVEGDADLRRHVIERLRAGPWSAISDPRFDPGRRLVWYALARIIKPAVVVESGCERGYGAVCLISALLRNGAGRYYGLDKDERAGWLVSGRYAANAEVIYGDSIETLKGFDRAIDLYINDGCHNLAYEAEEYRIVEPKLSDRAMLVSDNAHISTALAEFADRTGRRFLFTYDEPIHWQPPAGVGVAW